MKVDDFYVVPVLRCSFTRRDAAHERVGRLARGRALTIATEKPQPPRPEPGQLPEAPEASRAPAAPQLVGEPNTVGQDQDEAHAAERVADGDGERVLRLVTRRFAVLDQGRLLG